MLVLSLLILYILFIYRVSTVDLFYYRDISFESAYHDFFLKFFGEVTLKEVNEGRIAEGLELFKVVEDNTITNFPDAVKLAETRQIKYIFGTVNILMSEVQAALNSTTIIYINPSSISLRECYQNVVSFNSKCKIIDSSKNVK